MLNAETLKKSTCECDAKLRQNDVTVVHEIAIADMFVDWCRFAISNTDSSDEEEIFNKSKPASKLIADGTKDFKEQKPQVMTLSEKPPDMTHADWAMENLSRSPGS